MSIQEIIINYDLFNKSEVKAKLTGIGKFLLHISSHPSPQDKEMQIWE